MAKKIPTYKSLLRGYRKVVADLEQQIRDINYWNSLPQAQGYAIDCEDLRVALYHAKRTVSLWVQGETVAAGEEWQHVMKALIEQDDVE